MRLILEELEIGMNIIVNGVICLLIMATRK